MSLCEKVGYIRESKGEQNPEKQKNKLQEAGIPEDRIFYDKGVSGKVPARDRPAFKKLLQFIHHNEEEAKFLYVYELSRMGRNMLDTINMVDEIEKAGVMVWSLSPNEAFTRSEDQSVRQLMLMLMNWVAEHERENLVAGAQAGLDRARAEGNIPGRPRSEIDWTKVEQMREAGAGWKEIAQAFDMSLMGLYKRRKAREIL